MSSSNANLPVRGIAKTSVGWSITLGILLIVLGLIALAAPFIAGVFVETLIAWLLIFAGVGHLVLAWHVRGAGAHIWEALVGVAYIVVAIFLLWHPLAGLVSLTLFLGAYLLFKGIFELVASARIRGVPGGGWILVDGIVSILIALFIWLHLPYTAEWVVGTLLGVAILFSGISRVALALAARRSHATLSSGNGALL